MNWWNSIFENGETFEWDGKILTIYDEEEVVNVMVREGDDDSEINRIDLNEWSDFVNKDSLCGYNQKSKERYMTKAYEREKVKNGYGK